MITSEQFFQQLRSALTHLYDPYFLRKSPLVKVFGLGGQLDSVTELQRILNNGIAALEPGGEDSCLAQHRKNYELLLYRYVQQFGQEEVAAQMGLSVRHLRREQNVAIHSLAAHLWEQYQLSAHPFLIDSFEPEDDSASLADAPADEPEAELNDTRRVDLDIGWLKDVPLEEPSDLAQVTRGVIDLSRSLAGCYEISIEMSFDEALPRLAVHEVALRQLLLNILSVTLHMRIGQCLSITAVSQCNHVEVRFAGEEGEGAHQRLSADDRDNLQIVSRIAEFYGGQFSSVLEGANRCMLVRLPVFRRYTVLVIDDNLDFLQFVERSLTGTHYRMVGERSLQQVLSTAEAVEADVILLDVMMPGIDGWEILGQLRRHLGTAQIPVIICSILPQKELALSLGANDFLRKPVTHEQILAMLDRQMALREQALH